VHALFHGVIFLFPTLIVLVHVYIQFFFRSSLVSLAGMVFCSPHSIDFLPHLDSICSFGIEFDPFAVMFCSMVPIFIVFVVLFCSTCRCDLFLRLCSPHDNFFIFSWLITFVLVDVEVLANSQHSKITLYLFKILSRFARFS
jgi:hypothetical protein